MNNLENEKLILEEKLLFKMKQAKYYKKKYQEANNIIKEARKYIKEACWLDEVNKPNALGHKQTLKVLAILDKGE